ncbi:DUF4242 domain-containing protein [Dyadobacter sp. CY261]|uniref:DUF4242 domain-containing protein n=1 Tax=Dyadobacter sp. CY261 TaxID=2907203 RepID=UPI001F1D2779|nr:DUF4242 domain-containing protein [Dyadobacter sp. CY261]MCF0072873.1 DUF4242 domain-containing protein [Dyadobacter sp. CY261]
MKKMILSALAFSAFAFSCGNDSSKVIDNPDQSAKQNLYLDVHNLEPGKVTFEAVAEAHAKDLKTQGKYGVKFIKYWVDEKEGKVYCLAQSPDSASLYHTHKEAHGLVPDLVHAVSDGVEAAPGAGADLYLDIHYLGAGKVTAKAVEEAHVKDLATQGKYGVNFINYWVDEKAGAVMCLSNAKDGSDVVKTHKEAHGLLPDEVHRVKQGQ